MSPRASAAKRPLDSPLASDRADEIHASEDYTVYWLPLTERQCLALLAKSVPTEVLQLLQGMVKWELEGR